VPRHTDAAKFREEGQSKFLPSPQGSDRPQVFSTASGGIIWGYGARSSQEPPAVLGGFHSSLCSDTSPAQQLRSCTKLFFGNISGQFAACARSPTLVDDTDAAKQVHLCARHSGLRWRVFRRWSGILEFSLTTCKRISP
jgi:hypothetical protein